MNKLKGVLNKYVGIILAAVVIINLAVAVVYFLTEREDEMSGKAYGTITMADGTEMRGSVSYSGIVVYSNKLSDEMESFRIGVDVMDENGNIILDCFTGLDWSNVPHDLYGEEYIIHRLNGEGDFDEDVNGKFKIEDDDKVYLQVDDKFVFTSDN